MCTDNISLMPCIRVHSFISFVVLNSFPHCRHQPQVVCLREAERRLHLRCEELELHVGEQEAALREMEAAMRRFALDADRRLTLQHREHQNGIQLLLRRLKGEESRVQKALDYIFCESYSFFNVSFCLVHAFLFI